MTVNPRDPAGDAATIRAAGRARLLAGEVRPETPLTDGGRWGISAVLRPEGPVLADLADLAQQAAEVAGPGHWVHGPGELHLTVRSFEPFRAAVLPDDPLLATYAQALRDAASRVPPVRMELRGLSPHPGGVSVVAYPADGRADTLRARLHDALRAQGAPVGPAPRTSWHLNLLHFAAGVPRPDRVVAWCDARSAYQVGTVRLPAVHLVRWRFDGTTIRTDPAECVALDAADAAPTGVRTGRGRSAD